MVLREYWEWARTALQGYKTYLIVLLGVLTIIAEAMGWIDEGLADQVYAGLGIAGLGTLAAKINRFIKGL